jgi:Uma2 family endonuclease
MAKPAPALQLTYEDYRHLPADGKRYELIAGDLSVTPAPTPRHQLAVGKLHLLLAPFVLAHGLGQILLSPVDVLLADSTVVQPDLIFLAREHLALIGERCVQGAPDLAVEVISESNRRHDEVIKRHLYARFGVAELWLVDPALETVKVYRLEGSAYRHAAELSAEADDRLTSPLFPGLEIAVAEIFG